MPEDNIPEDVQAFAETEVVRPEVATLSEIPEDLSTVTMRFGVDLLKGFQRFDETSITPAELAYATQNFIAVANAIAQREGVPGSLIGYVLQETAVQELQLQMVAGVEQAMAGLDENDIIEAEAFEGVAQEDDLTIEEAEQVEEAYDGAVDDEREEADDGEES